MLSSGQHPHYCQYQREHRNNRVGQYCNLNYNANDMHSSGQHQSLFPISERERENTGTIGCVDFVILIIMPTICTPLAGTPTILPISEREHKNNRVGRFSVLKFKMLHVIRFCQKSFKIFLSNLFLVQYQQRSDCLPALHLLISLIQKSQTKAKIGPP